MSKISSFTINYRVILLIIGLVILYYSLLQMGFDDPEIFDVFDYAYIVAPFLCAISGFFLSYEYKKRKIPFFGRTYFILGLGFLFWFIGDLIYSYYNYILELEPYPLLEADVFFVLYYITIIFFIISNLKFFQLHFEGKTILYLILIPILLIGSYSYFAYSELEEVNFDFLYGLIFVVGAAVSFAFAVEGTKAFTHSPMKEAWAVLGVGISLITLADLWYYYSELTGTFNELHPLNILWLGSFMIIIYSLYLHKKSMY